MPQGKAKSAAKGSPKARRSAARLAAVQVLYQMRLNHQDAKAALRDYATHRAGKTVEGERYVTPDPDLLDSIVRGAENRFADIESIVLKILMEGGREKVEILLDCILRAGIFELLEHAETGTGIIINDYLNVTVSFYEGAETRLVNAILDKAAKSIRD
jgi:N utilization substance protein B